MPSTYFALLRGINVGGNSMIKMNDLKDCLEKIGVEDVKTYIQSGNIIFKSQETDMTILVNKIENAIKKTFNLTVPTLVLSQKQFQKIVNDVPRAWGNDSEWKYNLLFLLPPYNIDEIVASIGNLKPGIETLTPGDGVLYQSISIKLFGRTTTGKLASLPIYKRMTIRNHRTAAKILDFLKD